MMKVEVWSDYVCPFCYIGKRQLEQAIEQSGYGKDIEVVYKAYLLDPTTPENTSKTVYESLSEKYNMPQEEIKKMTENVTARAKEVGLEYNFEQMKSANTYKAHRLAKWIEEKDAALAKQYTERVLQAYFLEGASIGNDDVLLQIVESFNLSTEEAKDVLEQKQFEDSIQRDIFEAQQIGVRGVPFFVFNNKWGISGAQPQQLFEDTIEQAAVDAGLRKEINIIANGDVCDDDTCKF